MKQRVIYLDYIRSLACILVIFIHSPIPTGAESDMWAAIYTYISTPCIGLFFMTSGALLFPIKDPVNVFLKRRMTRVLWPFIFWSIVYLITNLITGDMIFKELPVILIQALYSPVICGVLWFMYALIGLYLFAPVVSKWLENASKRNLQYFLALWAATLLFFYFDIDSLLLTNFSGYLGYMVLGFYLRKHPLQMGYINLTLWTLLLSAFIPALIQLNVFSFTASKEVIITYLSINIAWLSTAYFTVFQKWNFKPRKFITEFATLSFGIYLIHILIEQYIVKKWFSTIGLFPTVVSMPMVTIITAVISLIIVKLISLTKVSRHIIG